MVEKQEKRNQERLKRREEREKEERMRRRWVPMLKSRWHLQQCVFYCLTLGFYFIGQDQGAESTEGKEAPSSVCQFIRSSLLWVRFVLFKSANEICCLLSLPGPVLVTAEGDAHALRHETGAVPAHAPGRGGDGIAADPAHAAEDTVTATSRAPDTSKHRRKPLLIYTPVKENWANTWRSVGYWLRRLRTVSENKRKQQLHGLFLSPLSSFKLVFWHFTHTILLFFFFNCSVVFVLLTWISHIVLSLRSSRDRERSSRDRDRSSRDRSRERDRRDGMNGRSDSRRADDRDVGDLWRPNSIHDHNTTASSRLSIYNILMLNTLARHPTPLFSRLPPFFALVQPECTHTIKYRIEFFCLVVVVFFLLVFFFYSIRYIRFLGIWQVIGQ